MTVFDELAVAYDNTINWEPRLKREIPFLLQRIPKKKDGRILDLACGSGRHAIELARQGFSVIGIDNSAAMIEVAIRHSQKENVSVEFILADMVDVKDVVKGFFDLILCLGNSLALLPSIKKLQQMLAACHSLLGEGGVFVSQTLNFTEIRRSGFRFFPLKGGKLSSDSEVIFARFFEPIDNKNTANLILTAFIRKADGWMPKVATQKVLQLEKVIFADILRRVGYSTWEFYGDYEQVPFVPEAHRNLVLSASR